MTQEELPTITTSHLAYRRRRAAWRLWKLLPLDKWVALKPRTPQDIEKAEALRAKLHEEAYGDWHRGYRIVVHDGKREREIVRQRLAALLEAPTWLASARWGVEEATVAEEVWLALNFLGKGRDLGGLRLGSVEGCLGDDSAVEPRSDG